MPLEEPIATTELVAILPDGARQLVSVRIGRPQPDGQDAVCWYEISGLHNRTFRFFGTDTLQALALTLRFAQTLLENEQQRGVRFEFESEISDEPEDGEPYEIVPVLFGRSMGLETTANPDEHS